MNAREIKHVYGPVASRRLGRSLGVDLVPFKTCTYDCIYCQLGRTTQKTIHREEYLPIEDILAELDATLASGIRPDYVGISGSGEPTLHSRIGEIITRIKQRTDVPVAVLTNGSLLWLRAVQDDLMAADLVLPSLDAGSERWFRHVNRPHSEIRFEAMVNGLAEFTRRFRKPVWLEVLLLAGMTGTVSEAGKIAALAGQIAPAKVQLNTASRPPCESEARPVTRRQLEILARLYDPPAEIISAETAREGSSTATGAASEAEIMALLRRRPCKIDGVASGLGLHRHEAAKRLQILLTKGAITTVRRKGELFYQATHDPGH
jgi:wyosine [tRNA(Phe)-imidazoG37] synthetase (radical SAM superfamily)